MSTDERHNPQMAEAAALIGELLTPVMDLSIGQRTQALNAGVSPEVADQIALVSYQTALAFVINGITQQQRQGGDS